MLFNIDKILNAAIIYLADSFDYITKIELERHLKAYLNGSSDAHINRVVEELKRHDLTHVKLQGNVESYLLKEGYRKFIGEIKLGMMPNAYNLLIRHITPKEKWTEKYPVIFEIVKSFITLAVGAVFGYFIGINKNQSDNPPKDKTDTSPSVSKPNKN